MSGVVFEIAFPDYVITSNETGPGYYIFVLAYTALAFLLIAPLVTWSRTYEDNRTLDVEQVANGGDQLSNPEEKASPVIVGNNLSKSHSSQEKPLSQDVSVNGKSAAASSISGSHALTQASLISKQHSVRSGRSGFGRILRELDKVAAAEYPDRDPDFRSRIGGGTQSVVSKAGTAHSNGNSLRAPSVATTSHLYENLPSTKKLSSLVLDVSGRRWKNRRPLGRVDVIQNAITYERSGSSISGFSSTKKTTSSSTAIPPPRKRAAAKGMSDVASSVLEEQNREMMRPSGPFANAHHHRLALNHRHRFLRRSSRTGSYSAASEKSLERSVMSSIVDDITPGDAADANDPGRGNIFIHQDQTMVPAQSQAIDSGLKLGCFAAFVETLLELAAPGEEMRRVVTSAFPLSLGAMSEALYRLVTAGFVSQYLGTKSMIAYLLVGLFVRLTSEELSGAIIDALSSFVQVCIFSGQADGTLLAGQYVQHAIILQFVLGVPLLAVWAFTMEEVVFWLVQSADIAEIANDYVRVVVFNYLVQSIVRTCTVVFHICGHENFESVIDFTSSTLQLAVVACVVSLFEDATLTTVGYIQVLIGIAGAVAKIMYPVMKGWMAPFKRGMFVELALLHNRNSLRQLTRAVVPLFLGTVLEYGEWEVLTLFLRHLGPAEVATWALLGAVWDVLEALTEGIGEASAIQVTFLLAAAQAERARKLANSAIYLAVIQSILVTSALYMAGRYLAVLFSNDPTIQHLMNNAITLIGLANVTMAFAQISWSLIGAQGRFRLATSVVFFSRWLVTIPTALIAIFAFFLDLNSVSGALVVGYSTASCALTFIVLRSDWERLARVMQEMNEPMDKGIGRGQTEEVEDEDHGDPFDDFDDDSDSSDGFGFGGVGDDEMDSETPSSVPSTAISSRSKRNRKAKSSAKSIQSSAISRQSRLSKKQSINSSTQLSRR